MSFPKQSLLAILLVFSAFCRAEVIRIFPQGDPDAVIADGSVKRSMVLRGKGTQSMEKEPGEAKFSFMRIAAAPGEKRCQAMANLRPAVSVGGTELHFSAQVRGSGTFDVGISHILPWTACGIAAIAPSMSARERDGGMVSVFIFNRIP